MFSVGLKMVVCLFFRIVPFLPPPPPLIAHSSPARSVSIHSFIHSLCNIKHLTPASALANSNASGPAYANDEGKRKKQTQLCSYRNHTGWYQWHSGGQVQVNLVHWRQWKGLMYLDAAARPPLSVVLCCSHDDNGDWDDFIQEHTRQQATVRGLLFPVVRHKNVTWNELCAYSGQHSADSPDTFQLSDRKVQ